MNTYTFASLNDKEFESLAVDLLSAETGTRLERFKAGKDKGVDGRWFAGPNAEVVVQCKHWLASGVDRLVAHLANTERAKVEQLGSSRYILVTSLPLSRVNKQRIAAAMAPYLVSESDVVGAEDLNDLLGRHSDVERRHYKLWLSSANTLALLLSNAILGRSRAELEQINYDSPLFVRTADYERAARQLQEKRVIVLTGEPGIGKTTLARQLVLEYATDAFELVVLEESISEAESVYSVDSKQLFYFDDFLGRTFLEALKAKQDSHILRFIERVGRDPKKRFVLTSRTNILNQGAGLSDLYSDMKVVRNTYELRVAAVPPVDRARILYNHIWHSQLSAPFVDELYAAKRYHQIVKHRNFNPRLVAFVVDAGKVADLTPATYWPFVEQTFSNPSGVWSHFFSAQLSQDDRDLTFLVVLAGSRVGEAALRDAFFALPSAQPANEGLNDSRFWKAVQHTSGSVLNRSLIDGTRVVYELYNPSIADFVQASLSSSGLWAYYYRCSATVAALGRLEQIRKQPFLGLAEYRRILWALHESHSERGNPQDEYNIRLIRLLVDDDPGNPEAVAGLQRVLTATLDIVDDEQANDCLQLIVQADGHVDATILSARADEVAHYFDDACLPFDQPDVISGLLDLLRRVDLGSSFDRLRERVVEEWTSDMSQHLADNNVLTSYLDPEDADNATSELRHFVSKQFGDLGIDLSQDEIDRVCGRVDLDEILAENIEVTIREDDRADNWRESRSSAMAEDAAIDDIFERPER
ncbi:hypothetical protein BH11GEM2_BH11GEM2_24540 [soil metagenome]